MKLLITINPWTAYNYQSIFFQTKPGSPRVSVGRPVSSLSQPGAAQSAAPHGGPGPVSHSSPRYPPQYMGHGQQVPTSQPQYTGGYQNQQHPQQHQGQYWGYQQAVEWRQPANIPWFSGFWMNFWWLFTSYNNKKLWPFQCLNIIISMICD